jgi:hypothetical protein
MAQRSIENAGRASRLGKMELLVKGQDMQPAA